MTCLFNVCKVECACKPCMLLQVGINSWRALQDIHQPHMAWSHLKGPLQGRFQAW